LNTLLATIHGINHETHYLTEAIQEGRLETRGNDWDFEGIWSEMISGVNQTLDAVIHPVNEARGSLQKLAEYDLCARMYGKYKGNHAEIKNAFNKSGKALREAFVQVADSVDRVATAGTVISENSDRVAEGAGRQSQSIGEVSSELEELNEQTALSLEGMKKAMSLVEETVTIMTTVKHVTDAFLNTIGEIVEASQNTETVLKDINAIATETNELAQTAGREAVNVEVAGRGFGVVAEQMQILATTNKEAVKAIENTLKLSNQAQALGGSAQEQRENLEDEFDDILRNVSSAASKTDLLALNAAIEAAQVTEAGKGFEQVAVQIVQLAKRAEEAARYMEILISKSVGKANEGKKSSQEISQQLEHVVLKTEEVAGIVKRVAQSNELEAERLAKIVSMMDQIGIVTGENTDHAKESRQVTRSLKKETQDLRASIGKFRIDPNGVTVQPGAEPKIAP
jgi:methyl-accepting chemotaxis protein